MMKNLFKRDAFIGMFFFTISCEEELQRKEAGPKLPVYHNGALYKEHMPGKSDTGYGQWKIYPPTVNPDSLIRSLGLPADSITYE